MEVSRSTGECGKRIALAVLLAVLAGWPVGASAETDLAPHECGACHETQYYRWTVSEHCRSEVLCADCHLELHSSKLYGCRDCHPQKHDLLFRSWPEVQQFDPPNSSDYVCLTCHRAHFGGLTDHRRACLACHSQSVGRGTIALHTGPGEFFVPTENDGFVLLEARAGRLLRLPRIARLGLSLVFFLVGTFVLFPLALGVVVISKPASTQRLGEPRHSR